MPSNTHFLDIALLGKEYRVACLPTEKEALSRAVSYLDGKMREFAGKTHNVTTERTAVMAALNIAHEFLSREALDIDDVKRRILLMEAQLDTLLESQDELI